jgi:diguanylate cyclase (GGDEF)-like protein
MLAVSFAFLTVLYAGRLIISLSVPMQGPIEKAHPDIWIAIFFMLPIVVAVANAILVVALTKERAEAAQRHIAEIDPLTGLLNRGATLSRVAAGVTSGPGAMLVFDLDRFKQINDRNGHPAGDRVLMEFAAVAKKLLRESDILGRIGGEEFLAYLPHAERARAMAAAERIRSAFAEARIELNGVTIPATVSIGIAIADGDTADVDPLLIEADRALYTAKENGRDRVQFFIPRAA